MVYLVYALYCFGVFWLLTSTAALNHFDLVGISQATGIDLYADYGIEVDGLIKRGHYRLCRHPIMFGFLIIFFATPVMTYNHLCFAALSTVYILLAVFS